MSQKRIHLIFLYFLPLVVTTNPGGDERVLLKNLVAAAVCSVSDCNNVASGDAGAGMFDAVCGAFQTPTGAALPSVPFWCIVGSDMRGVEQGFLIWRFYALYGGVVCYWIYLGGDVIFSVAVYDYLILLIVLFVI